MMGFSSISIRAILIGGASLGVLAAEPEVRHDIVRLAKATLERDMDSYIVINNRLEGSAPLTVAALAAALLETEA